MNYFPIDRYTTTQNTILSSKYFLYVGQKARNDLLLKSLGILFQSLGPVYCIDLCVKDF